MQQKEAQLARLLEANISVHKHLVDTLKAKQTKVMISNWEFQNLMPGIHTCKCETCVPTFREDYADRESDEAEPKDANSEVVMPDPRLANKVATVRDLAMIPTSIDIEGSKQKKAPIRFVFPPEWSRMRDDSERWEENLALDALPLLSYMGSSRFSSHCLQDVAEFLYGTNYITDFYQDKWAAAAKCFGLNDKGKERERRDKELEYPIDDASTYSAWELELLQRRRHLPLVGPDGKLLEEPDFMKRPSQLSSGIEVDWPEVEVEDMATGSSERKAPPKAMPWENTAGDAKLSKKEKQQRAQSWGVQKTKSDFRLLHDIPARISKMWHIRWNGSTSIKESTD